jgi:hypothetical protein
MAENAEDIGLSRDNAEAYVLAVFDSRGTFRDTPSWSRQCPECEPSGNLVTPKLEGEKAPTPEYYGPTQEL